MKLLFIAELNSSHTYNWLKQLEETGWNIHVFQAVISTGRLNWNYPKYTVYYSGIASKNNYLYKNTLKGFFLQLSRILVKVKHMPLKWILSILSRQHENYLKKLIKEFKPDIIHSHGLNVNYKNQLLHVYNVKKSLNSQFSSKWLYSSWGADLDYFAKLNKKNFTKITSILSECDFLTTECHRDKKLAFEMKFKGEFLGFFPDYGGVNCEKYDAINEKKENYIILKGRDSEQGSKYGDPIGRAITILNALEYSYFHFLDYEIFIYQSTPRLAKFANELKEKYNLKIQILNYLKYEDLLKLISKCKLFISITINDGLPSSLVEAMALGAFPIYSEIESIQEWIKHGKNGYLVHHEDYITLAGLMVKALQSQRLLNNAASLNKRLIRRYLSNKVIKPKTIGMYQSIVSKTNENIKSGE